MTTILTVRAGSGALRHLRDNGLRAGDIAILPGAAGGPKAIGMTGLDKAVFGWLASAPAERELIGASIGGWRFACAMQDDPAAALDRLAQRYTDEEYGDGLDPASITRQTRRMLDDILGPDGYERLLTHPHYRLTLLLAAARGLARSEKRPLLLGGLALAATLNSVSRPLIRHVFTRVLCHDPKSSLGFLPGDAIPTRTVELGRHNIAAALMGTVAIPGVLEGTALPGAPEGVYRDGGLTDYHIDFPYVRQPGIALYPHFTDRIVPGWFDKFLPWRKADAGRQANTLLVCPSREYLARLPGGKLPDRSDFQRYGTDHAARRKAWREATRESERLGDAFLELVGSGRLADVAVPL
ncbi:hypothetical protein [Paludibacterium paludis]|uniref:Patatin-like phospholipase family protein n=1 Tax=Paludibacterium paludis TaxID=1225769 RepID=A0A918UBI3_9NEIS|nr:hypothetical protein [Paludibacterium paludis]GGY24117.1 hypothetical protein GCM10011289_29820 [Paludibacterium paludis]